MKPITIESTKPVIWAHIDSWAELDMLQPVIKLFAQEGRYAILLTYSSSLSAKYDWLQGCDYIDYLFSFSIDTEPDAERLISSAKPSAILFAAPTHCSNFLCLLKKRNIPAFLIVGKITKTLPFFPWCGSSLENTLKAFTRIFVFDHQSKTLLEKLGVGFVTVGEYPPADEVCPADKKHYHDSIIERFAANEEPIFIGGNIDTDNDLKLVAHLANANPALKCILAPHTISEEHLNRIRYELEGFTRLCSECDENTDFSRVQVLVIDSLGNLSSVYRYGSCAYVGGGGTSFLHHVMEATANGLPIAFGSRLAHRLLPQYLVGLGVSRWVKTPADICQWEKDLESNPAFVHRVKTDSMQFMERGREVTRRIYTCITDSL